ncbi:MAG: SdpI family protein [Ruminococcus sp.]|jgi:hypothetical protein
MLFWIYMTVIDLLIPIVMIGFGKTFLKRAPKEINGLYGYRTSMSMKNRDTWEFAHHHFGRIWFRLGIILLPLSAAVMCFGIGKDRDSVSDLGLALCIVQLIFLICPIFFTERALRKNFDKEGTRKPDDMINGNK